MNIDIEKLVTWALRDQGLGWDAPGSWSAMEQAGMLGVMIAGGGIADPSVNLLSDEDAMVVRRTIDDLPSEARALVIIHGRTATRPEGAEEAIGEPVQQLDKRGRPRWRYLTTNKRGPKEPLYDILAWSAQRDNVLFARKQWTLWRESLFALVEPLNARMARHVATGPAVIAEPWLVAAPVVHGIVSAEASSEPQPWLRSEKPVTVHDRGLDVAEVRAAADADVRSVATDWSAPKRPIIRRKVRAATRQTAE